MPSTSEAGNGRHGNPRHVPSHWNLCIHSLSALSLALAMSWAPTPAHALSVGRVNVLSALGEPLAAEIDITEISTDEAASLSVAIASADAFRTAGLEYNSALSATQVSIQRRANGQPYLRIQSHRTINDPFVDLILEINWSSGRLVRDYTLLFDPRSLLGPAPVVAQLPIAGAGPSVSTSQASQPPTTEALPVIRSTAKPTASKRPAAVSKPASTTEDASGDKKPPKKQQAMAPATKDKKSTVVKEGDTASKIAARYKDSQVSLDQLLAAMLRDNPDAFINGDINRIKAGAVIEAPDAAKAAQTSPEEARQTLVAGAKNFAQYRQRAAQLAPAQKVEKAARQSSGKVEAKVVEDAKSPATSPDKLKLAKGMVQPSAGAANAQAIAQSKQATDTRERAAEVSKNIADLAKVGASTATPAVAASAATAASAAAVAPIAPAASAAASASAPAIPASAALAPASAASATASPAAAPTPAKPAAKAPPPPPPEPGFIEGLTEDPVLPLGAAGLLVALLGGFAFWRRRQQAEQQQHVDSSFLESRLQPDSFFGASGGQMVNTEEPGNATGSSMIYSPSQLDAAGDVDPVAEAEVYIAYGRDLQAEEILKEALRTQGSRVAVHVKLLEIYSKRRDAKAFEIVAREVYDLTSGQGSDWEHTCNLGRGLDPVCPLYQPGGKPSDMAVPSIADASIGAASFAASTMPHQIDAHAAAAVGASAAPEIDLDLDLFDSVADTNTPPTIGLNIEPTIAMQAFQPSPAPATAAFAGDALEFSVDDIPTQPASAAPAPAPAVDANALSFDLGALSLDLPSAPAAASEPEEEEDAMNTKLELASEFFALGDVDGARSIAQEVASEADGALKTKAQKLLSQWV